MCDVCICVQLLWSLDFAEMDGHIPRCHFWQNSMASASWPQVLGHKAWGLQPHNFFYYAYYHNSNIWIFQSTRVTTTYVLDYLSKRQTRWLVSWLALNIMCSIHTIINCKQHRIYIRILLHKKYFWVEGVWFCPKCDQHWCLRLVTFQMKLGTYNLLSK